MFFKRKKTEEELLAELEQRRKLQEFERFEPLMLAYLNKFLTLAEKQRTQADKELLGNYTASLGEGLKMTRELLTTTSTIKRIAIQARITKAFMHHATIVKTIINHRNLVDGHEFFALINEFNARMKDLSPGFSQ